MGKKFIIPVYLEDSIKLNTYELPLSLFKNWLFEDLLTNKEIAQKLTEICQINISPAIVTKIIKQYNIIIDETTKQKKLLRKAQKNKATLQAQFGVDNVFQLENIKKKATQTKLERYGNATYVNTEKAKQTCLNKYGVENYSSTFECKQKVKRTNLKRFGTNTPAQNKMVLNKMKATCIEKYGVDNYWKSKFFKQGQQQRYFESYTELTDLYKNNYKDIDKLKQIILASEDRTTTGLSKLFGLSRASTYSLLYQNNLLDLIDVESQTSHFEKEIADYIGADLCILNDRTTLMGSELDIYIPTKKIGIEFNGDYWHSTLYKTKDYHFNKSKKAEEHGIRLIHIWEYEWTDVKLQEKIKLMLDIALGRVQTKIYARNCEIRQITNKEAKILNERVHLQGHRNAKVTYGLFYNDNLVQLMSFSPTHYNTNLKLDSEWEIIRGCPGSNNIVVGGVSKLLAHFIKDYHPTKIFSYCDFNKFNGNSYIKAGMKFVGYTGPDMKWLLNSGEVINRNPKKHKELKSIAKAQIFGAGSKKYILEIS